jgi:phage baseplate assembly protein W
MPVTAIDIALLPGGDFDFEGGDFNLTASYYVAADWVNACDQQHVLDILRHAPGNIRQHPEVGCAIEDYLNGPQDKAHRNDLARKARIQVEMGGHMKVKTLRIQEDMSVYIDVQRINT